MKKIFIAITLSFFLFLNLKYGFTQNGFTKIYHQGDMHSSTITKTFDDNFLISGYGYDDRNFLFKIDSLGELIWSKQIESMHSDQHIRLIVLEDSSYLFTSSNYNFNNGYANLVCILFNNLGDTIWSKTFDFGKSFIPTSICQTYNDEIYICGKFQYSESPNSRIGLVNLDANGSLKWIRVYSLGGHANFGNSINQMPDSTLLLAGYYEDLNPYLSKSYLMNLELDGSIQWQKNYQVDSVNYNYAYDTFITDDGIMVGLLVPDQSMLIKTDFSGNVLWAKQYQTYSFSGFNTEVVKIKRTDDDNFTMLAPDNLLKLDHDGDIIWSLGFMMYVSDVSMVNDHDFLIAGNGPIFGVKSLLPNNFHIGLVKSDSSGYGEGYCVWQDDWTNYVNKNILTENTDFETSTATGISIASNFQLTNANLTVEDECVTFIGSTDDKSINNTVQLYPNPSSETVTIQMNGQEMINEVLIYNLHGMIVSHFFNINAAKLQLDISAHIPGVYLVKVKTRTGIMSKKLFIN